jgi:hypothetical protein
MVGRAVPIGSRAVVRIVDPSNNMMVRHARIFSLLPHTHRTAPLAHYGESGWEQ